MAYVVAVDIGGTFTDLVAFDHDTRNVIYTKSPTTYGNFVDGISDCFTKAKITPADAAYFNHGTTLVINSLIQRKGARPHSSPRRVSATFSKSRVPIVPIRSISIISATSRSSHASFVSKCRSASTPREIS